MKSDKQEGTCGNCNAKSLKVMENDNGVRIAHCSIENTSLQLPKKGQVSFKDDHCPICSFQVRYKKKIC